MAPTTGLVNGWFQTIDGLPGTTAPINTTLAQSYVTALTSATATSGDIQANLENFAAPPPPRPSFLLICFIARALRSLFFVSFRPRGAWFRPAARPPRSLTLGWAAL
jgi:hypothetical protein